MGWLSKIKETFIERETTQIVFDAFYEEICLGCKRKVEKTEHLYDKPVGKKILMECPSCHVAIYGKQVKYVKTLKTYVRDEEGFLGWRVIDERILEEAK